MVMCKICEQPINFQKQFITCKTSFHIACAGVDPDLLAVIEKNSGLSWCCLNLKFESFKTEFLKLAVMLCYEIK
jgi:hypothetical protein